MASLDVLGRDEELKAQAEQALRRAETGRQPGTHSGQDPTGSVVVLVDGDGRVEQVTVAREWRARLGVSGVADALFAAYTTAVQAVVEAAALEQLRSASGDRTHVAPQPGGAGDGDLDDELWLRQTWQVLHQLDADLERLARPLPVAAEQEVTSPSGCLTLRHRGGTVTAIVGDVRRIGQLDAGQLRHEAHSLLRTYALVRSQNRS
ncbi:hypothetical protein QQG74_13565 [Micromonospora sp. FIMYZ51]|uniref:hypothetical protein n=1 Tax=Micromonospora sp. FIMYZ51 TaxID=3051832 RepID=UPI00311D4173